MATSRKVMAFSWVLSVVPCLLLAMSSFMKFQGSPEVIKGFGHLGIPPSMMAPLAILEIVCTIVYLIPATSVAGAILLTGYMGGAICTHWRVGDPFWVQIVVPIVLWLALWLRDDRLKALLPIVQKGRGSQVLGGPGV